MSTYERPETYMVESPEFQKDGYTVTISVSNLPVNFNPNYLTQPIATLTITSEELLTFGKYPTHYLEVMHDKKAWGPMAGAEGDALAAQVWDDEVDTMIAEIVHREMLDNINMQVTEKHAQIAVLNKEHAEAVQALQSAT